MYTKQYIVYIEVRTNLRSPFQLESWATSNLNYKSLRKLITWWQISIQNAWEMQRRLVQTVGMDLIIGLLSVFPPPPYLEQRFGGEQTQHARTEN